MKSWSTQFASDIIRDGLGVELLTRDGDIVAEVFRSDANHTVRVSCWSDAVTQDVLDWLLQCSLEPLDTFEDGTPLPPISKWPVTRQ